MERKRINFRHSFKDTDRYWEKEEMLKTADEINEKILNVTKYELDNAGISESSELYKILVTDNGLNNLKPKENKGLIKNLKGMINMKRLHEGWVKIKKFVCKVLGIRTKQERKLIKADREALELVSSKYASTMLQDIREIILFSENDSFTKCKVDTYLWETINNIKYTIKYYEVEKAKVIKEENLDEELSQLVYKETLAYLNKRLDDILKLVTEADVTSSNEKYKKDIMPRNFFRYTDKEELNKFRNDHEVVYKQINQIANNKYGLNLEC